MFVAADYPFLDVLWTMLVFFAWIIWFWMLIQVLGDVFRRHDLSGWGKTAWTVLVIVLPFIGVLSYLVTQSKGMAERSTKEVQAAQAQFDDYVKSVASGPTAEIEKAHALLSSGAITQDEFDRIKQKALATA